MQIIVLGMHRSGTSLVTRLINMMGAYFGPEKAALGFGPDNPKGFWERRDALALNDAILHAHGCEWHKLARWPMENRKPLEPKQIHAIRSLVMDMDAFRPFVLKDPRLCLTFEYWKPHLEVPVVVIVHRDPLEVAQSLAKRNGLPPDYTLALWEYHAAGLLNAGSGLPCIHLRHGDALADPVSFTEQLHARLEQEDVRGLRLPSSREILAFVDPKLHRARAPADATLRLSPHQEMLAALLTGEMVQHSAVEVSEPSIVRMQAGLR